MGKRPLSLPHRAHGRDFSSASQADVERFDGVAAKTGLTPRQVDGIIIFAIRYCQIATVSYTHLSDVDTILKKVVKKFTE